MIAPPRPPSHDELEALIKEARERQLRRRLLGAAGVAIVAALGLCLYAISLGGSSGATAGRSPRTSFALCRSSGLSASSSWNGAAGSLINFFTIVNRGGGACSLPPGRPVVRLTSHGTSLAIHERAALRDAFPGKPLHVLAPGQRAAIYLQWSNWCGRPHAGLTATIALRFADGLRVAARHVFGQPPCMSQASPSVLSVSRLLTPN